MCKDKPMQCYGGRIVYALDIISIEMRHNMNCRDILERIPESSFLEEAVAFLSNQIYANRIPWKKAQYKLKKQGNLLPHYLVTKNSLESFLKVIDSVTYSTQHQRES